MDRKIIYGLAAGAFIATVGIIFSVITKQSNASATQVKTDNAAKTPNAKASKDIGRDFQFTLTTAADTRLPITYTITSAELMDEIIIGGQRALAVEGRTFLVLNVKITNNNNQGVQFNSRNFVRLSTAANPAEWLAPEIHNDPIEVQAISTKYSRLGFPVDNTVKSFRFQVGEIEGNKEIVEVTFE